MRRGRSVVPTLNLDSIKAAATPDDSQLLSLDETTVESLRTPELMTDDRICNREHLKSLGLYELIICVICQ